MRFDLDRLPADPVLLQRIVRDLFEQYEERGRKLQQTQHELARLQRAQYGRSAEKLDPAQLKLILEQLDQPAPEPLTQEPPAVQQPSEPQTAPVKRPGHGRNQLPDSLPREPREHPVAQEQLTCSCGHARERIGEETSEQLDYRPASFRVIRHVRPKYACRACQEGVVVAPTPVQPIEKGLATAGMLAYVVVSKFADHLPLTRQEQILARHGVHLSRSTLADWTEGVASLLWPLVKAMRTDVLCSRRLHVDDTPVPVLDRTRDRTREGRLWALVGDSNHPYVVFAYSPNKKQDFILSLLGRYEGYLQADAAKGYDALFKRPQILEVGCWAHARRGFYEALPSDEIRALLALATIRQLYDIEGQAKLLDDAGRCTLRQEQAKPAIEKFGGWLTEQLAEVLPKSPMAQAIGYVQRQWTALNRYLEDGTLAIDNNAVERELRRVAVGRGNWLFCGSDRGGESAATLYSLVATCKRHGVEPWAYFADVLERISTHPASRIEELLPDRWKALRPCSSHADPPPVSSTT